MCGTSFHGQVTMRQGRVLAICEGQEIRMLWGRVFQSQCPWDTARPRSPCPGRLTRKIVTLRLDLRGCCVRLHALHHTSSPFNCLLTPLLRGHRFRTWLLHATFQQVCRQQLPERGWAGLGNQGQDSSLGNKQQEVIPGWAGGVCTTCHLTISAS